MHTSIRVFALAMAAVTLPSFGADVLFYDIGDPSAHEVAVLETVNRLRANPTAESVRMVADGPWWSQNYGLFVDQAMFLAELGTAAAVQPLAFNRRINQAAVAHATDMAVHDFLSHTSTDGGTLLTRLIAAGYPYYRANEGAGISLSAGDQFAHSLFVDPSWVQGVDGGMQAGRGHRVGLMAPFVREVGVGFVPNPVHSFSFHAVIDYGTERAADSLESRSNFLTGVAFTDLDHDGFYTAGEGAPDVSVELMGAGFAAISSTHGAYTIPFNPGESKQALRFRDENKGWIVRWATSSGTSNVKVDVDLASLSAASNQAAHLVNLSTRGWISEAKPLIGGLVVTGNAVKRILVRAIGPGMVPFGLPNPVAKPRIQMVDLTRRDVPVVPTYTKSANAAIVTQIETDVFAFLTSASEDQIFVYDLAPGIYTAVVTGADGTAGLGLIEMYEVGAGAERMVNISTRAFVGAGDEILIAGFVVSGSNPKRVLIRGVGPALTAFGVTDALADPVATVFSGSTAVLSNDDWGASEDRDAIASEGAAVYATSLDPAQHDAAMIGYFQPGVYTVHITGKNGTSGTALAEIYELP